MPTSRVGAPGWFVRIGRPRYACIESAEMGSAGNRDANSSATAVFPEAVGPNSASTQSNCMPRLWCFRSHGPADTSLVKLPRPFGGRTHLDGRPRELAAFIALGAALSAAAVVGVSWAAGFGAVSDRLRHVDARWLPLAVAAEVLAYVGYVLAYREVARVEDGPRLPHSRALALVATGFGVFIARGGFSVDLHAFRQEFVDDREARVRVLGLGALEYALLAPATCIVAILLLLDHVHQPGSGLTMPWAIAVPTGGVLALAALRLRDRLRGRDGWRDHVAPWLDSLHAIKQTFVKPQPAAGPIRTGIVRFGDIACLAFCLRAFEGHFPSVAPLLIGYATGYALTRRTLPLAGAGAVEALLPFALLWTGTPLAAAVTAVLAYRIVNFLLPIGPAVFGLRSLRAASTG